ncbi:uncharacterized protein CDV56_104734 [Aspergillus thermomutatus]|uniref:Endonuclease/exonuclease/phosphatase domain-containing protein n=1 Tax=Aspergillus thermomutatus TaxID=41047 RepID=A0A397H8T3_ASPTH|nr:uncharacterized protein CDV56_104734 [Aspergillus thermomutatus]RHZ59397.1 hypothetical protein CDV56_104734 [Aspergillus thermomutatus]
MKIEKFFSTQAARFLEFFWKPGTDNVQGISQPLAQETVKGTLQELKDIYPELREAAKAEVKYRFYRSWGVCFANISMVLRSRPPALHPPSRSLCRPATAPGPNKERFFIRVTEIIRTFFSIVTEAGDIPESATLFRALQQYDQDELSQIVTSLFPEQVQVLLGGTEPKTARQGANVDNIWSTPAAVGNIITGPPLPLVSTPALRERFPDIGIFSNAPFTNSAGVAWIILDPKKIPLDKVKILGSDDMGIYAPNQETPQVEFCNQVADHLESGWGRKIQIMLGDFNAVESALDRNPPRIEDQRVREALKRTAAPYYELYDANLITSNVQQVDKYRNWPFDFGPRGEIRPGRTPPPPIKAPTDEDCLWAVDVYASDDFDTEMFMALRSNRREVNNPDSDGVFLVRMLEVFEGKPLAEQKKLLTNSHLKECILSSRNVFNGAYQKGLKAVLPHLWGILRSLWNTMRAYQTVVLPFFQEEIDRLKMAKEFHLKQIDIHIQARDQRWEIALLSEVCDKETKRTGRPRKLDVLISTSSVAWKTPHQQSPLPAAQSTILESSDITSGLPDNYITHPFTSLKRLKIDAQRVLERLNQNSDAGNQYNLVLNLPRAIRTQLGGDKNALEGITFRLMFEATTALIKIVPRDVYCVYLSQLWGHIPLLVLVYLVVDKPDQDGDEDYELKGMIKYHAGATYQCLLAQVGPACRSTWGQVPTHITWTEAIIGNNQWAVNMDELVSIPSEGLAPQHGAGV